MVGVDNQNAVTPAATRTQRWPQRRRHRTMMPKLRGAAAASEERAHGDDDGIDDMDDAVVDNHIGDEDPGRRVAALYVGSSRLCKKLAWPKIAPDEGGTLRIKDSWTPFAAIAVPPLVIEGEYSTVPSVRPARARASEK